MLTELEGAILSEIVYRGNQTAFQVRRSFADSPSLEWKGSAGAVYPAVKRLENAAFIVGVATGDRRSTKILSVTKLGREAMLDWACEAERAVSTGIDPVSHTVRNLASAGSETASGRFEGSSRQT